MCELSVKSIAEALTPISASGVSSAKFRKLASQHLIDRFLRLPQALHGFFEHPHTRRQLFHFHTVGQYLARPWGINSREVLTSMQNKNPTQSIYGDTGCHAVESQLNSAPRGDLMLRCGILLLTAAVPRVAAIQRHAGNCCSEPVINQQDKTSHFAGRSVIWASP